ncbi:MAG: DUF2237 domain-containing protein [Oscillatoriales cyanobacterium]|nr:MAG: DUF2237 domain-containing protein [Oscillatoriales cyanobacterium]
MTDELRSINDSSAGHSSPQSANEGTNQTKKEASDLSGVEALRVPAPTTRNVLGGSLQPCCLSPMTGFYRTGSCETGSLDRGSHTVCAQVTEAFLAFTKAQGNDLSAPAPWADFPGLKPGDRWCLCASRWQEALVAGVAPPVDLQATHAAALNTIALEDLQRHALPISPEPSAPELSAPELSAPDSEALPE